MQEGRSLAKLGLMLVVNPRRAFVEVHARPVSWWWPCSVVLLCTLAFWTFYFTTVDPAWLVGRALAEMGRLPPGLQRGIGERLTPQIMLFETVAMAVVGLGLKLAVVSGYLQLVARLAGDARTRFLQWLALVSWASLPAVASVVGMALGYALAPGDQVDAGTLSTTRLAVLFQSPDGHPVLGSLLDYDLARLWTLALLIVGVRVYRKSGRVSAAATVLVPWAVLLGARLLAASA